MHAILGCDTTSGVYGIGKGVTLHMFEAIKHFQQLASVFHDSSATEDMIASAGKEIMVLLYKGKAGQDINDLRYQRFCQKTATSAKFVHPQTLPPTANACIYHSLRVYHQVQQWSGNDLDPCIWGWKLKEGSFRPIRTDNAPAPPSLLKVVKCNCTTSACAGMKCTCKKHGLECSSACGECRGLSCQNSQKPLSDEKE